MQHLYQTLGGYLGLKMSPQWLFLRVPSQPLLLLGLLSYFANNDDVKHLKFGFLWFIIFPNRSQSHQIFKSSSLTNSLGNPWLFQESLCIFYLYLYISIFLDVFSSPRWNSLAIEKNSKHFQLSLYNSLPLTFLAQTQILGFINH